MKKKPRRKDPKNKMRPRRGVRKINTGSTHAMDIGDSIDEIFNRV